MSLPVLEIADPIIRAVQSDGRARILIKAPTGSGKSTEIPGMILEAGIRGKVLVIEPRRMAARMLATWVAAKRGTPLGAEVGYAVRHDTRYRNDSRIVYLTDGVFQRWIQDDPGLHGVDAVVFDEFHERRLAVDMTLARCLDLQDHARPDLRVVVMSATLETKGLAEYLTPVTILEAGGRTHPVDIHYWREKSANNHRSAGPPSPPPVWERMVAACIDAMALPDPGNILMFLPGTYEIRKTIELLERGSTSRGWEVYPLYSSLPPAAQDAAVRGGGGPKIIVSTNVAETSLTIDGVRTVIDSGLARVAAFEPRRAINTLRVGKISRAAAEQRAGRAGRTAPGRAFRLWSQADHARRDEFDTPEVHRIDLTEALLLLKASGIGDPRSFRWFDPPKDDALARAEELLHVLGATDTNGSLTDQGNKMAAIPLEPRFSCLLLAGARFGCVSEAAFIAAAVQGEGIFARTRGSVGRKDFLFPGDGSDFFGEWRAYETAVEFGFDPKRCSQVGILARGAREISQGLQRLERLAQHHGWTWEPVDFARRKDAVGQAMLAAFSDQLGMRFSQGTLACRLVGKRRGKLDEESCTRNETAFVATEITEVEGREIITHLRRATAIDPSWLQDHFPDEFIHTCGTKWDDQRRRAISVKETKFRDLVIESRESDHSVDLEEAAHHLAQRVLAGELVLKQWDHRIEQWIARLDLLSRTMPELEIPTWGDEDKAYAIAQVCHGAISYKEVKDAPVWPVLSEWLNPHQKSALESYCPIKILLKNGQSANVCYETGRDPWISLRVSHLFGVWDTPRICNGKIPLLVKILTPGQKPWQMTKDLKNFWASGYFQMKKEIAGRYPKHPWPDHPEDWLSPKE